MCADCWVAPACASASGCGKKATRWDFFSSGGVCVGCRGGRVDDDFFFQLLDEGARPFLCAYPGCGKMYLHRAGVRKHVVGQHKPWLDSGGAPEAQSEEAEEEAEEEACFCGVCRVQIAGDDDNCVCCSACDERGAEVWLQ